MFFNHKMEKIAEEIKGGLADGKEAKDIAEEKAETPEVEKEASDALLSGYLQGYMHKQADDTNINIDVDQQPEGDLDLDPEMQEEGGDIDDREDENVCAEKKMTVPGPDESIVQAISGDGNPITPENVPSPVMEARNMEEIKDTPCNMEGCAQVPTLSPGWDLSILQDNPIELV